MKQGSHHFAIVAILGTSFWFILVFPFGHHNESYRWLMPLNNFGIFDWLSQGLVATTFRPLGQVTAWVSYRLSGGSIFPVQLFNYLLAMAGWLLAFKAAREKRVFALVSLGVGAIFFSGYIYLFHIHGVFYSPVLVLTGTALVLSAQETVRPRQLLGIAVLSAVLSLYHPFAILVGLAIVAGLALNRKPTLRKPDYLLAGLIVLVALALVKRLETTPPWSTDNLLGFMTSFKMVEVHPAVALTALLLAGLTTIDSRLTMGIKLGWLFVLATVSLAFFVSDVPIILVWIIACLVKAIACRNWPLAVLVLVTAFLPMTTSVGTPSYTVFAVMTCCYVTAFDSRSLEDKLRFLDYKFTAATLAAALLLLILLRSGVSVPIASRLATPILAEREKTFQLEEILAWVLSSEFADADLVMGQSHGTPLEAQGEAIDRRNRPPTNTFYLRSYMDWQRQRGAAEEAAGQQLVFLFGGAEIADLEPIYIVPGRHAGAARVYLKPISLRPGAS